MRTPEDQVAIYDHIYRSGIVEHSKKGILDSYGSHSNRDYTFLEFLERALRPPARVLDASCGRGHLAAELRIRGYEVEVSEISPWLCKRLRKVFPVVHELTYDRLGELETGRYDVVISNDVLEHLLGEAAVIDALDNLVRLARKFVMISVGTHRQSSKKYPVALGMRCGPLHTYLPGVERWGDLFYERLEMLVTRWTPTSYYWFGRPRGSS